MGALVALYRHLQDGVEMSEHFIGDLLPYTYGLSHSHMDLIVDLVKAVFGNNGCFKYQGAHFEVKGLLEVYTQAMKSKRARFLEAMEFLLADKHHETFRVQAVRESSGDKIPSE